jgi:hypothetical protein
VEFWFYSGTREACALAFSKVKSDFIKSALRPFVGLREPKVFRFVSDKARSRQINS